VSDRLHVVNPADEQIVGAVDVCDRDGVQLRAAKLREAQRDWAALDISTRVHWLGLFGDWLLDNAQRLGELLISETGKSSIDATMELPGVLDLIRYYGRRAEHFLGDQKRRSHSVMVATKALSVNYRPYPLVSLLSPWNYPIYLTFGDAVPALLAGCAVLVKPSELAPLTVTEIVRGWREDVGAPPVLDVANGGPETGQAVVDIADFVQFTGSSHNGTAVGVRATERLVPASLELGGKDPMLVLADADVDRAVSAAVWGGLCNAGQSCASIERVYVHADIYDEFVEQLCARVRRVRLGAAGGGHFEVGALISERQRETVERHVADAVNAGARVVVGGRRPTGPGFWYEPTVLAEVDHTMLCMREETFGPVLPVMRVENDEEAVALANDSVYGLSASVWSRDRAHARSIAQRVECAAVNINDVYINLLCVSLPQGGWGASGLGARLGGPDGIRKFCRTQSVVDTRVALRREPQWYPANPVKLRAIIAGSRILYGRGAGRFKRMRPRAQ
jgi:acyl-CoA reductase-like NAD-dependent aldehyde dehydrogenase